jgi:hypothetical protein
MDFPASASSVKPIVTSTAEESVMRFAGCVGGTGFAIQIAVAVSWTIIIIEDFIIPCIWT